MARIIRRIIWGLFAVFIIAQFFQIDKTNPEFDASKDFLNVVGAPDDIAFMLKTTCYDCHSYETKYPWYTSISPLNWWIKDHIDEGRDKLNFSIWADYPERRANHKLEECYEEVENMLMPLRSYTRAHSEARLTPEQRATIVEWFKEQEQKSK